MVSHRTTARIGRGVAAVVMLACSVALLAWAAEGRRAQPTGHTNGDLAATIFSYDGKDFVRTKTNLTTEDGKSAVNTKLDHANPAYQALTKKHSYVGEITAFGKKYDGDYAPLTGSDGKLTGALFVGVEK
jgi:hypothetical protein